MSTPSVLHLATRLEILSASDMLPQVCSKTKSLSRIYITFPSQAPFCWCIIKHVFWKMKESNDERDYLWFPSELPQSHPHFPTVYLSFSLVWVCSYSIFLWFSPSLVFRSHSLNSFLCSFSFLLCVFNCLVSHPLLFLPLLMELVGAKGSIATVISACVCMCMHVCLGVIEVLFFFFRCFVVQSLIFPPCHFYALSLFLALLCGCYCTSPSVSAQWVAASVLGWGPPLAAAQCDHSGRAPSPCSQAWISISKQSKICWCHHCRCTVGCFRI